MFDFLRCWRRLIRVRSTLGYGVLAKSIPCFVPEQAVAKSSHLHPLINRQSSFVIVKTPLPNVVVLRAHACNALIADFGFEATIFNKARAAPVGRLRCCSQF